MSKSQKTIKKTLSLSERIIIPSILPKEGSWQEMKLVRNLSEKLYPTKEEDEKYEIRTVSVGEKSGTIWNSEGSKAEFEMEFDEVEHDIVQKSIRKMDETKKLTLEHISIYDKFGV